ncbi:MAG: Eco57I restriction-modification methylase domain-containing protein [Subdoligranulum variabile]|nr:Eco57I restriction-modification methylase domain-containing protein [Subdoligranulum variabile]
MMAVLRERVTELVQTYSDNYPQFQRATYNETQVRVDFVNRFFKLLGWDVDNERGLPQHLREVTHEATVIVEEDGVHRSKKPDYSFRVGTDVLYFLETKKPAVNITVDAAPAFQLRRYGWSGNLKISVLTNFTDLYIYDCSIRPREGDDIGVAMIAHYHFDEYVEHFQEIYNMLSKEAVLEGEFEHRFGNIRSALRREPFDQYFLDQIRNWRNMLGADILFNNPDIDVETLNIFVQRVLNRVIFLRICEDRCFEDYESLKAITTYQELRGLFAAADQKYDSGLFELLEEDRLTVSDAVIINIFQSLYYPNNSYEFGVIDPYIIGQIYELFLDEALIIREDGHIEAQEKPEVIDSQGTVNTPKNITDIIVEETLSPLYAGKRPEEVAHYRIADICCGSGNFLLSAFEYIVNYHIEYYLNHDKDNAERSGNIYQLPGSSNYVLSYEKKRSILQNNIFGVDIDPLAVEVAKFSLLLKALENSSLEEAEAFHRRTHLRILPNLDENIKNGNSFVNMSYAQFDRTVYQNIPLMNKLKMFDWNTEFGNRKFDAIIGNPPYIRVQNMVHYSKEEYNFYKSNYSPYVTAQTDTLDKYYLFIEKGLALLNNDGILGYIVPHKFMNIQAGVKLRELLTSSSAVRKILHFGTYQVFENRSTYTCILILTKQENTQFEIGFVQDWNQFLFNHNTECATYPEAYITGQPWSFLPQNIVTHLDAISESCVPLSTLVDIFVGLQTSADDIYIIYADSEDANYVYFHNGQREFKVEKGILRKGIYDIQITSYEKIAANCYIIFPYKEVNGKPVLYSLSEMSENFPNTLFYLSEYKEQLDRRKMTGRKEENWFAFGRSQSVRRFLAGEHLVWPVLSTGSNYVYDSEMIAFTGGGNGPFYGMEMKNSSQESIFYIQAILNHWLMELLVKSKASTFRGDYYSHGKQFIAALPIYKIDFENPAEAAKHQHIVEMVHDIMRLKGQLATAPNAARRTVLQHAIMAINADLNKAIDELYQVESQEVEEQA